MAGGCILGFTHGYHGNREIHLEIGYLLAKVTVGEQHKETLLQIGHRFEDSISVAEPAGTHIVDLIPLCESRSSTHLLAAFTVTLVAKLPLIFFGPKLAMGIRHLHRCVEEMRTVPYELVDTNRVSWQLQLKHLA